MRRGHTDPRHPSCPECGSYRVFLILRPGVSLERDGQFSTFINGSSKKCSACGHEWDRKAHRGVTYQVPEPKKEGFFDRLFHRLFPHLD